MAGQSFKVGDEVRLVEPARPAHGRPHPGEKGDLFTVAKTYSQYISVKDAAGEVHGGWFPQRFELVTEEQPEPIKTGRLSALPVPHLIELRDTGIIGRDEARAALGLPVTQ